MGEPKTTAATPAVEYVKLGGPRRGKLGDNIIDTRRWAGEPKAAQAFWDEKIASLPEDRQREAETNITTMNF